MKPAYKQSVFEHSDTKDSSQFTIRADGKAFRLLIDGIYSDKITSCVRELSTNAFDAHQVIREEKPFYVHCPTTITPEFYVRDYGCGMDHHKIMSLYSTLFGSDKTGDNNQAGMFGLGSKTPFAYTDQFHLTCWNGETARYYSAGVGKTGVPEIHLLLEEPSSELKGVKVGFAVQNTDFGNFQTAIRNIHLGFRIPFECNVDLKPLPEPNLEGNGWTSYNESRLNGLWYVRQGCVLYPVEQSTAGLTVPSDYTYGQSRRYIMDVPIGTVEITTSREAIQYTPPVVKYLNKRFERVVEEAADRVWDKVKDIENTAEFFDKIQKIKPAFVSRKFAHPITGCTETTWHSPQEACRYVVNHHDYDGKWSYQEHHTFSTEKLKTTDAYEPTPTSVYEIQDISAFLDQDRKDRKDKEFSAQEHRRVSRHLRRWMESKEINAATFFLGVTQTDEFWHSLNPQLKRIPLTTEELLCCAPVKKEEIKSLPFIRGVSVALNQADPVPCEEIKLSQTCGWVSADIYRYKGNEISKLAKRFGLDTIYVVTAAAVKRIEEAKVPDLMDRLKEKFQEKHKIELSEWIDFLVIQRNGYFRQTETSNFFQKLLTTCPDSFKAFLKTKNPLTPIPKFSQKFWGQKLEKISGDEWEGLKALSKNDKDFFKVSSPGAIEVTELYEKLRKNSGLPSVEFLTEITSSYTKERFNQIITALHILFRTIPLED